MLEIALCRQFDAGWGSDLQFETKKRGRSREDLGLW